MKQNEDGTLSFGASLDLSGVDEAAEKLNAKIAQIGENAEIKGSFSGMAKRL